ncbi:hypothetical protein KAT80_01695 [Candidatus Pacearchaeota archaeon]|nr:hypothetical protein [Candidatus Pacearchaeota archaeon]
MIALVLVAIEIVWVVIKNNLNDIELGGEQYLIFERERFITCFYFI